MEIADNKTLIASLVVMLLGLVMIFGTSYSIITKSYITENNYSLTVGNMKVSFSDNENKILLSNSFPISDKEALETGEEFLFTVNNLGDYTANYSITIEETSEASIAEVIRFAYSLNDGGYNHISTLSDNKVVGQNVVLESGNSHDYKMKFWIDEDANASYMGKIFSAKLVLNYTQNDYKYATSVIETLGNINQDGVIGINSQGEVSSSDIREYRYVGNTSNNYVWFNCSDGYTKGGSHCEKWRIIGSFDNTWENGISSYKTIKLIRSSKVSDIPYNDNTYNGAYNKSYLNYYANTTYYNTLTMSAKNMILRARWNIGKTNNTFNTNASYLMETSEFVYNDIGVISPSDYAFAGNGVNYGDKLNNQNKNWMYHNNMFTLNLNNNGNPYVVSDNGITLGDKMELFAFVPVVYLKPDVSIINGYGTVNEPYELDIKFPMSYGTVDKIK